MEGSIRSSRLLSLKTIQLSLRTLTKYHGSDMAQIGWIEVTTENGAKRIPYGTIKSEHETRLRFEDYLETAMVEAVPAGSWFRS